MSDKKDTWERLTAAKWAGSGIASTNDPSAKFQLLNSGSGSNNKDEYRFDVSEMPTSLTPENLLRSFALDPNGVVNSSEFNLINYFKKRASERIALGDIYDIDILGPDNGSIVIVAMSDGFGKTCRDSWFDIQTISCKKTGTHPECGAREFGYNYTSDGGVSFYTRGVSRPSTMLHRAGASLQYRSWMSMMGGLRNKIKNLGGKADGSIAVSRS